MLVNPGSFRMKSKGSARDSFGILCENGNSKFVHIKNRIN